MFLSKIDIISEPINIFYKDSQKHSSKFSIALSIFSIVIGFSFLIYSFSDLWVKSSPLSSAQINKYTNNAGSIVMGKDGMFHYVTIFYNNGTFLPFNQTQIKVTGQLYNKHRVLIGIYNYQNCNPDYDYNYVKNLLPGVSDEDFSSHNACIDSFTNATTNETTKLTKDNLETFYFPELLYGMIPSPDLGLSTYYSVSVNTFADDLNFYSDKGSAIFFVDNQFDITNYTYPIQSKMNSINNLISIGSTITNSLNINPAQLDTSTDLIFSDFYSTFSYYFTTNAQTGGTQQGSTLATYGLYLQNDLAQFKRIYKTLQEALAEAGGFFNMIFFISKLLNLFPGDYKIAEDFANILDNHLLRPNNKSFHNNENQIGIKNSENIMFDKKPIVTEVEVLNLNKNNDINAISKSIIKLSQIDNLNLSSENLKKIKQQEIAPFKDKDLFSNKKLFSYICKRVFFRDTSDYDFILNARNEILNEEQITSLYSNVKKLISFSVPNHDYEKFHDTIIHI